ncbi:hypothetical protein D4R52_00375 [bacterium]|nr:MAG: hypothetical protein D4R52_00375 [bacterium]
MDEQKSKEISWDAAEFLHYPKSITWFVFLGAVGVVLVGFFLYQRDYLTATMFFLFFLILFYFSEAKPKILHIRLTQSAVKLNQVSIPYSRIKKFWIAYAPPDVKTLNFETAAYLNRYITIQLENENPVKIREFLLQHIPEDLEQDEQFGDKISRTLKF